MCKPYAVLAQSKKKDLVNRGGGGGDEANGQNWRDVSKTGRAGGGSQTFQTILILFKWLA